MAEYGVQEEYVAEQLEPEYDPDKILRDLDGFLSMNNIADILDEQERDEIGRRVYDEYLIDETSRSKWLEETREWMKLAKLTRERKMEPWPNAASIKYPIITQAALQFSARAYQAIIKDNMNVVKGIVIGEDENGEKAAKAQRIGEHMSYQYLEEVDNWVEDTDTMLVTLALIGLAYRKTYRNNTEETNASEFVPAEDVVVNYWEKRSLDKARRITHLFTMTPNEIREMENAEAYLPIEYGTPTTGDTENGNPPKIDSNDRDAPFTFLEQHRWLDMDGDGYQEPYIVTIEKESRKVVRIVARYDESGIIRAVDGSIIRIKPIGYFTKFYFFPSLDGSYYPLGFGQLLGPGNEIINTTTNQLLDAGSLNNAGGGFIDSNVKLIGGRNSGNITFKLGEYKKVQLNGDDIRKMIYDRPTKEPSQVLYQLLDLIIKSNKELSSVAEIFSGQMPAAGTPATTTMAAIEQGMKTFTTIYMRIHNSLKMEYRKMRRLNRIYLPEKAYYTVLDNPKAIAREDYDDSDCDVIPVSNPNEVTDTMRLLKGESLMQLKGQGLNDAEITKRYLEALHVPDADKILEVQEPQGPSMKEQIEMKKLEMEQQKIDIERERLKMDWFIAKADAIKTVADAEAKEAGIQIDTYKAEVDSIMKQSKEEREANSADKPGSMGNMAGSPSDTGSNAGSGLPVGAEEGLVSAGAVPEQGLV